MSNFKRVVHCGIDFNLMETGDADYREACLKAWLSEHCTGSYRYEWSSADTFTVHFDSEADYNRAAVLSDAGIPDTP